MKPSTPLSEVTRRLLYPHEDIVARWEGDPLPPGVMARLEGEPRAWARSDAPPRCRPAERNRSSVCRRGAIQDLRSARRVNAQRPAARGSQAF